MGRYVIFVVILLFSVGCSSEPEPEPEPESQLQATTLKLDELTVKVQGTSNSGSIFDMKPYSISLGDKYILYVPEVKKSGATIHLRHDFYEFIDGRLVKIQLLQRASNSLQTQTPKLTVSFLENDRQ